MVTVGCAAPKTNFPRNVVAIESDGTLRTLDNQRTLTKKANQKTALVKTSKPMRAADRGAYNSKTREHLQFIFEKNQALDTNKTILIFIQGGMNNVNDGVARADRLTEAIMEDPKNPAYPIFIAWDANLFSAWMEQYITHRGQSDKPFGIILSPLTFLANVGRLVARLPLSVVEQGYAGLRTLRAPVYGNGETKPPRLLPRPEEVNRQYQTLLSDKYLVQFEAGVRHWSLPARGGLMLVESVPKILWEGVVDTGGKIGWDFMLRRTRTMFTLSTPAFDRGAMDFFGEELVKYMRQYPEKRLVIVGHSMGSIVANELIRRFGDQLRISDIVYMAAACGVEEFDRVVIPHLLKHGETSFYNLSLHPGNDTSELPWLWAWLVSPRGSLLDWIDFYYSSADTDYGWTLGKWDNAMLGSSRFLLQQSPQNQARLKQQVHLKSFGYGPELQQGPQHHGGFDLWQFWNPAFWKLGPYDPDWYYMPRKIAK
jgi:pimeloyl-ACP methyl ester carboxylesterase